ncbi:helix-turn-helix domain-containing protein [Pasteurella atlantica]|uniref:Helix-turn-helix domain-containing protein n=2 Tax=Pasteurellaceae TaxID=712 RepID=A0ACC6HJJ5_9PAST|nr:helix-turn-helix domain-containing protein [Pasteurella atlantica]MDP8051036.1 helix-turn-helix domain-containing protein [Pasteurella atlantica]MDP8104332.1 helix-turn-helix domain-containing protein [Pasteurella atlantica]MDP8147692.1 helix-turn-helix domain-containing protein [Pasteurella atlantica]
MAKVNLSEWVKKARNKAGITQEALAQKLNMTKANISAMENGRTLPSFSNVLAIATLTGSPLPHEDPDITTTIKSDKETIMVPEYSAIAECGFGYTENEDFIEVKGGIPFNIPFLKSLGVHTEDACIIHAEGDSMSPTIQGGASVLLDLSKKEPVEEAIFAILRNQNGIVIKRLRRNAQKEWLYSSDNPNKTLYPDLFAYEDDRIIGRVLWQGGIIGL